MAMRIAQLQRTLWLVVKEAVQAPGKVQVDEAETNPLWEIRYERPDPKSTKLTVIATALPEATEEQILHGDGSGQLPKNSIPAINPTLKQPLNADQVQQALNAVKKKYKGQGKPKGRKK
mgnify:CR=1 FL=1